MKTTTTTTSNSVEQRRRLFGAGENSGNNNNNNRIVLHMAMGRGRKRFAPVVVEVKPTMNAEIKATELRVVTPNPGGKDTLLGVMPLQEALDMAKSMGNLDLILVNEKSDPPVCKIVDYSKYRYMQEKKAKEVKKNSKATEIKEVKMSYKIDVHDYSVRMKNAGKFINQGNRVKATVMFRGREVQHDKLGFELLDRFAMDLEKTATKEGRPKREGRNLSMIFSPRVEVMKQINQQKKADEKAKRKKKNLMYEEKGTSAPKAAEVAGVVAATSEKKEGTSSTASDILNEKDESDDEDSVDIESSLDDLLGGDDDLDDIFS